MRRQIDKDKTIQVRISRMLHHKLKVQAAKNKTTIRAIIESQFNWPFPPSQAK